MRAVAASSGCAPYGAPGSRVSSVQRPAAEARRSYGAQSHAATAPCTPPAPDRPGPDGLLDGCGGSPKGSDAQHGTAQRRSDPRTRRAHLRDEFDDVREEAADARRRHLCGVPARRIGRARQMTGADRCARPPPVVQRCTEQAPEPLCYGSHLHTVVDDLDEHLLVLRAVLLQSARAVVRRPPHSTEPAVLVGSTLLCSPRVASARPPAEYPALR